MILEYICILGFYVTLFIGYRVGDAHVTKLRGMKQ